jgi:uncharacterized protein (TIGR03437 family)
MRIAVLHGILLLRLTCQAQPPAIVQEGVRNLASRMPPSLPGGAVAPGALIQIEGLRLAGADAPVRVVLRQNQSDLQAHLIKASPDRIEARMPAAIRAGPAQLIVVRDGLPSRPFALRIAPSAFGIFSQDGRGWGPGEIFNLGAGREQLNTPATPAAPGDTVALRGTGLGTARTVRVFAGEKPVAHVLSGQSLRNQPGVDEIRFQLAKNTPLGCYVPLLVKTDDLVSNVVTISIARDAHPCPASPEHDALLLLARLAIHLRLSEGKPVDVTQDIGAAIFPDHNDLTLASPWLPLPGACTTYTGGLPPLPPEIMPAAFHPQSDPPGRDAGRRVTVSGPRGTLQLFPQPSRAGLYVETLGGGLPSRQTVRPLFLEPGSYRISAPGGRDIGSFEMELPSSGALRWIHPGRTDTVDRARGVTLRWRGADARQQVVLVAANVDAYTGAAGICICLAPGQAGRWFLPPPFLANLPASQNVPGVPLGFIFMAAIPADPQQFHAHGVAGGVAVMLTASGRTVNYR